jgi:hypothetical protein
MLKHEPIQTLRAIPLNYSQLSPNRSRYTHAVCSLLCSLAFGVLFFWPYAVNTSDLPAYAALLAACASILFGVIAIKATGARKWFWVAIISVAFSVTLSGVWATALLRSYRHHPDDGSRRRCAIQMELVGSFVQNWAAAHNKYPGSLDTLLNEKLILATEATCPAVRGTSSNGGSYTYWGAQLSYPSDPAAILLTESLENHHGDGINVYSCHGKVHFLDKKTATAVLVELKAGQNPPRTPYQK